MYVAFCEGICNIYVYTYAYAYTHVDTPASDIFWSTHLDPRAEADHLNPRVIAVARAWTTLCQADSSGHVRDRTVRTTGGQVTDVMGHIITSGGGGQERR